MNRQIIQYKITFSGPGNELEIRYLTMETISYHSYLYLVRKLMTLFPVLYDLPFSVNWKDKEGDIIRICSDDELTIALEEMKSDPVKKIFIIAKQQGNESILNHNIVCDGCDDRNEGFRYKCLICDDYELCRDCEILQIHPDHPMVRIPNPPTHDKPFKKQFTEENENLSHIFKLTGGNVSQSSNHKNPSIVDLKQPIKICDNAVHNIICYRMMKTIIKYEMNALKKKIHQEIYFNQNKPSTSTDIHLNKPQNVDVLTNGLTSLSIGVNSGGTRKEAIPSQDGPIHIMNRDEGLTSPPGVYMPPTTASSTSGVLQVESNPATANQLMSQMDVAPIPADPTPVLQAQLTPPISSVDVPPLSVLIPSNSTVAPAYPQTAKFPVPLSTLIATASAENSIDTTCSHYNASNCSASLTPPPIEDDCYLDNSWSFVGSEQTDNLTYSSDSIATLESPRPTPSLTPQLSESLPAKEIGLYEESIRMLHILGFEKKEWLNLVVESKEGDIKEVLKFLSPVKRISTNIQ